MDVTEALLRIPPELAPVERLCAFLVETGQCDLRTVERGRRVSAETGQRVDHVLLQLGLISERGLAQAYGSIFHLQVVKPTDYPAAEPLFTDRLGDRFFDQVLHVS
jgi:general secretion pathway protein E